MALDAAHAAREAWGETSTTDRAKVLNAIADAIEANLEMLAVAESWENGKPVRETLGADVPLAIDHFRYFAGAIRAEEGRISEIDKDTVAYHFNEPLGVVGQIVPFNFPLLMAAWKLAPALAAGNCVVIKPASPPPWSLLKLMEVLQGVVPPGVINVVTGPGASVGMALASSKRIAKIAFTGEFAADAEFDSGTGWPSFVAPVGDERVALRREGLILRRTEVRCATCDSHLGHVFADGPRDRGGRRYCINSVAPWTPTPERRALTARRSRTPRSGA